MLLLTIRPLAASIQTWRTTPDFIVTFRSCAGPPASVAPPASSTLWPLAFQSTSGPSKSACSAERAAISWGIGTTSRLPSRGETCQPVFPSHT